MSCLSSFSDSPFFVARFVAPRFNEYLQRADARCDLPGQSNPDSMARAVGDVNLSANEAGAPARAEGAVGDADKNASAEEADLVHQAKGKASLRLHRERHGNMLELSTDALGNRELQYLGRHIYYSTLALYEHYQDSIPALVRSPMSVAHWHARRAAGDWKNVIVGILHNLTDMQRLDKCGIGGKRLSSSDSMDLADECSGVANMDTGARDAQGPSGDFEQAAPGLAARAARDCLPSVAGRSARGGSCHLCGPNCEAEDLEQTRVASLIRNVLSQVSVFSYFFF